MRTCIFTAVFLVTLAGTAAADVTGKLALPGTGRPPLRGKAFLERTENPFLGGKMLDPTPHLVVVLIGDGLPVPPTPQVKWKLLGESFEKPLLPVIALLIKLDSPGPLLFKQRRVGKRGRLFTCYKFRSMVRDAETMRTALAHLNEATGPAFKIRHDPRVTEVGGFLRRSSLDEIPQLVNVILGQMSIVGPRPQIPAEVELYEAWHRRRLEVKPGITCLWQISGREPNAHVGVDVQGDAFLDLLVERIGSLG